LLLPNIKLGFAGVFLRGVFFLFTSRCKSFTCIGRFFDAALSDAAFLDAAAFFDAAFFDATALDVPLVATSGPPSFAGSGSLGYPLLRPN
jgi:hypothetical protein